MRVTACRMMLVLSLIASPVVWAQATRPASTQPVTTLKTPAARKLLAWYAQGTAAGNVGDYYDNRDRGHSNLPMAPYPQLSRVSYTQAARGRRLDWAAQRAVLGHVTFGNSSTSAPPQRGGSNPRMYYNSPRGLRLLYLQYTHNNLYIYPEHRDHDPGRNGAGGYGDLYCTNTPYLIISQGSSGSDQPFMRAMPMVLAAFRPEVKAKLVKTGLLMPTVQMIFRASNSHLYPPGCGPTRRLPDEVYLSGKAHPTVFEGRWVNVERMIERAHAIDLDEIPPMVRLTVVEEDLSEPGRGHFDNRSEKHADTPGAIARLWRGVAGTRRMVVSADDSFDVNGRPLTYRWVVLRGEPSAVRIRPTNERGSTVEITLDYPQRRPVGDSGIESNRVDIGAFVHNGRYWSAPAFVTWMGFDDEARTYAPDGRVLDIGYGAGHVALTVTDWVGLLEMLRPQAPGLGASLLRAALGDKGAAAVRSVLPEYRPAAAAWDQAQARHREAIQAKRAAAEAVKRCQATLGAARNTTAPATQAADPAASLARAKEALTQASKAERTVRRQRDDARKAADAVLDRTPRGLGRTVREAVEQALDELIDDPMFAVRHAGPIGEIVTADTSRRRVAANARKPLVRFGLLRDADGEGLALQTVRGRQATSAPAARGGALTRFERLLVRRHNAELLCGLVLPKRVSYTAKRNFVDRALAVPKDWRDVYHYDAANRRTGWTRYGGASPVEFGPTGTTRPSP